MNPLRRLVEMMRAIPLEDRSLVSIEIKVNLAVPESATPPTDDEFEGLMRGMMGMGPRVLGVSDDDEDCQE